MNFDKRYNELLGIGEPALRQKSQNPKGYDPVSKTPSWLALAALNEIVASEEQAKLAQGAATKPLPSVKEQLSQKAASMQADAQKQQSAMQNMGEQMAQAPQPTPEGIPQPEPQPQEEPPVMTAAAGGLARLPVDSRMFDYREGGIISFQSQGAVPSADAADANLAAVQAQAQQAVANLRRFGLAQQQQDPEGYKQAIAEAKAAQQAIIAAQQSVKAAPPPAPPAPVAPPRPRAAPPAVAPRPAQPPAQLPAQQAPAGLAALPDPIATAKGISAAFPVAGDKPDADAFLADQAKFRQASGARRAGEPQQEELDAYQKETARIQAARGKANAIKALSGYGGLAGLGQRHAANLEQNILEDTIRNDAAAKMRTAMEGMKQAEAEGNMTKYAALKKEFTDAQNTRATASALAAGKLAEGNVVATTARERNISEEGIARRRDETSLAVAKIQAAVSREAKAQGLGTKEIQAAEAAYARDPRAQAIKKMLESPMYSMGAEASKRAQPLIAELEQIQRSKYTQFGATLEPSPGAKASALKYNPATGKIE